MIKGIRVTLAQSVRRGQGAILALKGQEANKVFKDPKVTKGTLARKALLERMVRALQCSAYMPILQLCNLTIQPARRAMHGP